ncbi:hypothetical protein ebA4519 [Aromatoleum aromaticum EbN1]|uniref:Uncharacterized protein n=1 Tax=Aromatoleum aromaticum (strain DSM 19018 / LMG 30748 / EbN1) TaxID=76114 RepID=Q5P1X7_AROAE|nr:hypothetical protein ebA4519 [Aromatoleum aromaticum EbN1]
MHSSVSRSALSQSFDEDDSMPAVVDGRQLTLSIFSRLRSCREPHDTRSILFFHYFSTT